LPIPEDKIELTAEPIPIMRIMRRGKFYSFSELYKITFRKKILEDVRECIREKRLWRWFIRKSQLQTTLDLLVISGKLRIGKKRFGVLKKRYQKRQKICLQKNIGDTLKKLLMIS